MALPPLPRLLLTDNLTAPFPSPPNIFSKSTFRPSIIVIIGVLTTMFFLTLILLLYAKHCNRTATTTYNNTTTTATRHRNSGVDRSVVNSLPIFRFTSLTGSHKDGLECAVCLNKFEPLDLLRLLPRCKHAFHVECVDIWLEAHSTCPLCRVRVNPEDVLLVLDHDDTITKEASNDPTPPSTVVSIPLVRRISGRHSSAGERCTKEVRLNHVGRRVSEGGDGNAGVSVGCFEKGRKDGMLLTESKSNVVEREEFERRYSHRIIVSGSRERWSDLKPSDMLHLRSESFIVGSGRGVNSMRSVSEITGVSRFREVLKAKRIGWRQINGPDL